MKKTVAALVSVLALVAVALTANADGNKWGSADAPPPQPGRHPSPFGAVQAPPAVGTPAPSPAGTEHPFKASATDGTSLAVTVGAAGAVGMQLQWQGEPLTLTIRRPGAAPLVRQTTAPADRTGRHSERFELAATAQDLQRARDWVIEFRAHGSAAGAVSFQLPPGSRVAVTGSAPVAAAPQPSAQTTPTMQTAQPAKRDWAAVAPAPASNLPPRQGPAPTNVSAVPAPTTVTLKWSAVPSVLEYVVERNVGSSGQWTSVATVTDPGCADAAMDPDTPVQYRVTARYTDGRMGTSAPVATRTTKTTNPPNLRATVAPHVITAQITPTFSAPSTAYGDVTLTWDGVPGANSYEVSGTGLSNTKSTTSPTYVVPQVAPGAASYQVIAYFMNGVRRFGDAANPSKVAIQIGSLPVSGLNPVTYAGNSLPTVDFRWDNSNGATGFKLFRAESEFGPFLEVTDAGWATRWARDQSRSLQRGKSYYYKLLSSFASAPIAFTPVSRVDIPAPVTIAGLVARSREAGKATLSWSPVFGATEYNILRGTGPGKMDWIMYGSLPLALPGNAMSYDDSSLQKGATYQYTLCAKIPGGSTCSDVSVTVAQ